MLGEALSLKNTPHSTLAYCCGFLAPLVPFLLEYILMPELAERIESVRAGVWGAIALATVEGAEFMIQSAFMERYPQAVFWLPSRPELAIAIALGCGFLFGIAYRYIVRDETNPHLRQGAVWAFSGVRFGALLEAHPEWVWQSEQWLGAIAVGMETVLAFGLASLTLDFALHKTWLKPLKLLSD